MAGPSPPVTKTFHVVGSICLPATATVFHQLCARLGPHLRRIPDGEPGKRGGFIIWQKAVFDQWPDLQRETPLSPPRVQVPDPKLANIALPSLEYDTYALESYKEFGKQREAGIIPPGVRFQVCLPTPMNILCNWIEQAYRPIIEPIYEKSLLEALQRIQESIPAQDLAIQFDCPSEFAFLEGVASVPVDWFSPVKEGLIERTVRIASMVHSEVELGFHFCYGDFGHKHFVEPKDTNLLVEYGNALLKAIPRRVNWIHMPVSKMATDTNYFASLKQFELGETELYLGLIHMNDEEGSKSRIEMAKQFVPTFGISTECGLGRATQEELDSVLKIASSILRS